ncbi:MAG: BadF/BadG/BcrA/BcrD ATPase family protein [Verrucomicrobiota bacterium]
MGITSKANFTLGIEGGGTKTTWSLLDEQGKVVAQGRGEASNLHHSSDPTLLRIFAAIRRSLDVKPHSIGAAFAGCHLERDRQRVKKLLMQTWPKVEKIVVDEDTCSAFVGCHGRENGIIIIAGTGSNVFGIKNGRREKAMGWGSLMADFGSGYSIARAAFIAVYDHFDETQKMGILAKLIVKKAGVSDLEEFVGYILNRESKTEVASFTPCVFEAAEKGDPIAKKVIAHEADLLAKRVGYVSKRLGLKKPNIGMVGSLFEKQPTYFKLFAQGVKKYAPPAKLFVSEVPGSVGAALLVKYPLNEAVS